MLIIITGLGLVMQTLVQPSTNSNSITAKTATIPLVTALDADNVTPVSFNAKWQASAGLAVEKYILEVAKDAGFTNKVRGYDNLELGADITAVEVAGLNPDVNYFYRLRRQLAGLPELLAMLYPQELRLLL